MKFSASVKLVLFMTLFCISLACPALADLVNNDNGTIIDTETGLTWEQGSHGDLDWKGALGHCDILSLAGHDDWRMPTIKELGTIVDLTRSNPAVNTYCFGDTANVGYWTNTTRTENLADAWIINFTYGDDGYSAKSNKLHVRAVRGGPPGQPVVNPPFFQDNGDGTVTDNRNELTWAKATFTGKNWHDALAFCDKLSLGGFSDWRLPTIKELDAIASLNRSSPAVNTYYFPDTVNGQYWTSTTRRENTYEAWVMDFTYGDDSYAAKSTLLNVRAVRGGSPVLPPVTPTTFTDNGDGTITDWIAGLMWQQTDTAAQTWKEALAACANLKQGGYSDWRTPTIKELATLASLTRSNPAINTYYFPTTSSANYWSSTTQTESTSQAWAMNFMYGDDNYLAKANTAYVRAVRLGQSESLVPVIAQQPMSGPIGTTFVQWGTGFTPNSIATLHFKKPDGTEYHTQQQPIDAIGHFEINYTALLGKPSGTYTWWAIDGATGAKSNEISYVLTPLAADLVILPSAVSFLSLYPGETSSQSLTVSNTLPSSVTIVSASISGSNASDFSLGDSCSGNTLTSNSNCIITANFTPRSCGSKVATLTVSTSQGNLTANLSGSACSSNGSASLSGAVRDAVTMQPLNGVAVLVGTSGPYNTNASGKYLANGLSSGTYELNVSKQGYDTWIGSISLNPQQSALKDIKLTPATATALRVMSITSKYSNGSPYYFLPGIAFDVAFTASVDWGGKTPGKVRFITSKGSYDVATSGTTASKTLNIGTECNSCSTLQAVAIAADGSQSVAKKADFIVTDPLPVDPELPLLTSNLAIEYSDSSFRYRNNSTLSKNLLEQTIGDYKKIPILKNSASVLQYVPEFDFEFVGKEGKASYTLSLLKNSDYATIMENQYTKRTKEHGLKDLQKSVEHLIKEGNVDRRHFPKAGIAGFEFSFFPSFQADYNFNTANCGGASSGWNPMTGYAGLAGGAEWGAVYQSLLAPPLPPIPWYFKPAIGLDFDAMLNIKDASNMKPSGNISASPYISGTIGVGVNDVIGLEGTGKGGVDIAWQFPVTAGQNAITDCGAYLSVTGKAYFFIYQKPFPTQRWDENCFGGEAAKSDVASKGIRKLLAPDLQKDGALSVIPRDYLESAKSAAFQHKPIYKETRFTTAEQTYSVSSSPIVSATFPVSSANLSSAGSNVNLVWLADNPGRSSINRTMAVHSAFDGISWSTPVSIADNGTADFNPTSLTLGDGSIISAWEDVATPLADTATLEELTAQLEIGAALYNPIAKTWGPAVRLTNNLTLDRTPKLAGKDKTNLLLTWISNDQNDISGSATNPNQLKYALYNGTTWSAPTVAAVIPNQIKRYNVVYDGATANVVLALDTDNDPSTLEDLELYRLVYSNGAWGTLTRLTSDTTIDDNPQLSLDTSNNVVMTWLMGKELSGVVNFDFAKRTLIRAEETYTSSLADFRQATTTDGRVAVIYADISENNTCDLFGVFYDPIFKLWGHPKQLTDDAETEQWPSIAFMGTDTIIGTYNRKLLINPDGTPTDGALSDLYMIKHTLSDDLAVVAGSLTADIPNAAPGTAVTLSAKVQNLGDNTAQNIAVSFYQGDPASGGALIGTVVITEPLKPGDTVTVSLPWTIPDGSTPVTIYVVIDPGATIDTLNRSNNVASITLALPDLKIQSFIGEKLAIGYYNLVVSVANIGGTASGASNIKLHLGSNTGPVIATIDLPPLVRFASVDLAYEWHVPAPTQSLYTLVAIADEGGAIVESNKLNNSYQVTLMGDSVVIGDINGDQLVDLADAILCLQVLSGMLPGNINPAADVNGDGKIGMAEAIYAMQKAAGL